MGGVESKKPQAFHHVGPGVSARAVAVAPRAPKAHTGLEGGEMLTPSEDLRALC